ncbi:MAG: hypothetical protein ACRYFX_18785 [Janthinobacterium lividum]
MKRLRACLRLLFSRAYILYTPDERQPADKGEPARVAWANVTTEDADNLRQWCEMNPK